MFDSHRFAQTQMLILESNLRERGYEIGRLSDFYAIARGMAIDPNFSTAISLMNQEVSWRSANYQAFVKASQGAQRFDEVWATAAGQDLSQAFLDSIAEGSLLEQLLRYGFRIPNQIQSVLSASGAVADVVAEGDPIAVRHLTMNSFDPVRKKAAAIVVMSQELVKATDRAASNLFERELQTAVLAATNAAALQQFTNVTNIAATGSALGDLTAGLAAAQPASAYVVAADSAAVAELALQADGRMSVSGGAFVPGVVIVPIPSDSSGSMRIIPATNVGVVDDGLRLIESTQGTVAMSDTPTSPAQHVSLWQTDSIGLLVSRSFALVHNVSIVEVG